MQRKDSLARPRGGSDNKSDFEVGAVVAHILKTDGGQRPTSAKVHDWEKSSRIVLYFFFTVIANELLLPENLEVVF